MRICNACRYCEGFCALFPAIELRRILSDSDLEYLSNLCHNCRDCFYACQYAPPHEFNVNVPKVLAELRMETYRRFCWPSRLGGVFRCNALVITLVTLLAIAGFVLATVLPKGLDVLLRAHTGQGSFYEVIPYSAMVTTFSLLGVLVVAAFVKEIVRFWDKTGGKPGELQSLKGNIKALWDALRLKYLAGAGYGCNYPDEGFSMVRR